MMKVHSTVEEPFIRVFNSTKIAFSIRHYKKIMAQDYMYAYRSTLRSLALFTGKRTQTWNEANISGFFSLSL